MRRWAFNLFCLFSLLAFVGSIPIWVRSYYVPEAIIWMSMETPLTPEPAVKRYKAYGVGWQRGGVCLDRLCVEGWGPGAAKLGWQRIAFPFGPSVVAPRSEPDRFNAYFAGFQVLHAIHTFPMGWVSHQHLAVPLWLFLPAAIPPYLWWRRYRSKPTRGFAVETDVPSPPL